MDKITTNNLNFISSLVEKEYKVPEILSPKENDHVSKLLKTFRAVSIEEVIRKALFYQLIDNNASKEYLDYIEKCSKNKIEAALNYRNELFYLSNIAPPYIKNFCLSWKQNNNCSNNASKELSEFNNKIRSKKILKEFIKRNHKAWLKIIIETGGEYRNVFDWLFNISEFDKEYIKRAKEIAKYTNYLSLECLYLVINYIDNNFPIRIYRQPNERQKEIINFLLTEGTEIDILKNYSISEETLKNDIDMICNCYGCKNINTALNYISIKEFE